MSTSKNDGAIPYGSIVLTINSITYVADSFSISRPSKTIERTNETDLPSGQVSYDGFVTGSATLQLASGSTAIPAMYDTFTTSVSGTSETFYIDSVTQPLEKAGERKVNINFRKTYSA